MRVVLVQPPRRYWPYTSEGDNFLLPQALPALAAPLREAGHEVFVVDCMPLHLGWRSLGALLRRLDPDVVAAGENHALYVGEALRFFRLCKEMVPRAVTVAGGAHFTNLWPRYLGAGAWTAPGAPAHGDIDVVVIGEGEATFAELVAELAGKDADLRRVRGIAFQADGEVVRTEPRPLVADLDALPLPAYDLVPMHLYGRSRYLFSPGATTIHHSRGCTSQCTFCAWWTTMADRTYGPDGQPVLKARWRTKSPERVLEEVEVLHRRFGKQALVWVDESWNISPEFSDRFADLLLASGMKLKWFAFFRADGVVRDERLGILEKLVRAGLAHVCIGVERAEDDVLEGMNKRFYRGGVAAEALGIFKRRYPEVFLQGTFIVGTREETPESLARQVDLAASLGIDYPAFHPVTPVPGTVLYDQALREGWITEGDFSDFDWMTPVMDSRYMTRDEIALELWKMNRRFVNVPWLLKGLASRVPYKRDMYTWFALVSARMAADAIRRRLNPFRVEHYQQLVTPDWYEG